MSLLKWLVPPAFYPKPETPTNPYANAMTPDQLIMAHIHNSVTREFDDWKITSGKLDDETDFAPADARYQFNRWDRTYRLEMKNRKRNFEIEFYITVRLGQAQKSGNIINGRFPFEYSIYTAKVMVKGQHISLTDIDLILPIFRAVQQQQKMAHERKKALDKMKENERLWNIAEDLTGLARTTTGALVPRYKRPEDRPCTCSESQKKKNPHVHLKRCAHTHPLKCECASCLTPGVVPAVQGEREPVNVQSNNMVDVCSVRGSGSPLNLDTTIYYPLK